MPNETPCEDEPSCSNRLFDGLVGFAAGWPKALATAGGLPKVGFDPKAGAAPNAGVPPNVCAPPKADGLLKADAVGDPKPDVATLPVG